MPYNMMIGQNTPGTQDVPGYARDFNRLAHIIQFGKRYLGGSGPMLIKHPSQMIADQLRFGDLYQHTCKLILH